MQTTLNTIRTTHQIIDESFNIKNCSNYALALLIGERCMEYCILDLKKNKVLVLLSCAFQQAYEPKELNEALYNLIDKDDKLNQKYKSIKIGIINSKSTLIPEPLFDFDKAREYLTLNHLLTDDDIIKVDSIKTLDAENIYTIPKQNEIMLQQHFIFPQIYHFSTALIESILIQNKNKTGKKTILHIQTNQFETMFIEDGKLIFYNSFFYQTKEDLIYYVLFTAQQLGVNPEQHFFEILGNIEKQSDIYELLYKYIRNIVWGSRNTAFEYSYKLNELPPHYYYNLFNLNLCE